MASVTIPQEFNKSVVSERLSHAEKVWGLKLEKFINRGMFGVVYLATDDEQRKHAIKISPKSTTAQGENIAVYLDREVETLMSIRHKNVVNVYHAVSFADSTLIDMEFCDMSLKEYICRVKDGQRTIRPLNENEFHDIARQLTSGICAIHGLGIAHRDIKPQNVLLNINKNGSFTAKFTGFALAKNEISARTCLGSPVYTAPEVLSSDSCRDTYTNRCDFWSLGIMYYLLLVGKYPFVKGDMTAMRRTLCMQEFVAISLPATVQVSECCRNFVRRHLFKDPDSRMCDEEARRHPFLMPTVHVLHMKKPVDTADFFRPMFLDVDLGDLYFAQAKQKLGDSINDPGVFLSFKRDPILWNDVARAVGITDRDSLNDILVYTNGGVYYKNNDLVDVRSTEDIPAFIVSSRKGVEIGEMKMVEGMDFSEANRKLMDSKEQPGTVEFLNPRFVAFSSYIKCCRTNCNLYQVIMMNCHFIKHFQQSVLKTDYLVKKLRALQDDLSKKFVRFPKVEFRPLEFSSSFQLSDPHEGHSVIETIRKELAVVHHSAQEKVSGSVEDLSDEMKQLIQIWEQHKEFFEETKKRLSCSYEAMVRVTNSLQKDVEVILRLTHYIEVLEKALKGRDVGSIYPELLPLVKCEYLKMSSEDMEMLERAS